ncbi:Alanine--tRNA ligase, cytoplasmic [Araneus ventricosus]|uniref:Alanine--tRNA ligase n=1 Tax=Araneus ventricosus TaxID=182803 RepID=A0A4Y2D5L6_ARAVE|nr:Alanine--tRNA ligase, cytoplasmic [Araneus ventricosus]
MSKGAHLPSGKLATWPVRHCLQVQKVEFPAGPLQAEAVQENFTSWASEKNHTYVPSSPVFLNNDPSLLFVNAGMNQFRSLFLNKTYPGHPLHNLKRAANSQKCVRLSGKHNDLKDVGVDLYHHTFFEMLGNWSFGDYSKAEACKMAWELLINVYGLRPENLYVTYFGGDKSLEVPPDEECRRIWLEIGVHPSRIFPFGAKDNFWEMADKGPCGPCTEIHYDFLSSGPETVAQKINADSHDVMEIWNLVFVQYNREKGNVLKSIPTLNVDTGMGLERLTAVLQGTRSNYNTDLFIPLFEAIESNFRVRPYSGKTGIDDADGLDTAYRILADHSRMFSVAIADGVFPDSYDTGHVLRKIIRRAAYTANRVMKTRPGALSSLVPYVAKTLDFYPEIDKHIDEIIYIVNDEEKTFHNAINRGRKARNKMISESPNRVLTGQQTVDLHDIYGLENNIIQDLADEVNVAIDWKDCERVRERKLQQVYSLREEKSCDIWKMINDLTKKNIPLSDDSFKYCYSTEKNTFGVKSISANILAIFLEKEMVSEAKEGTQCILVLDKTNFYSEAGGQISDVGNIYNQDFNFQVNNVTSSQGYVFHHGQVTKGKMTSNAVINMDVDKKNRLSCSQNHTATHLLNAALRKILPYTAQRSSHAGPSHLKYTFSAKEHLTDQQLKAIEMYVNQMIQKKLEVFRNEVPFEELLTHPNAILLRGEEYPETVSVISIGNADCKGAVSVEPCCGTHVHNTADIESFVLIPSKSHGSGVKVLSAVTGDLASVVQGNGKVLCRKISDLKQKIDASFEKPIVPLDTYLDLLKQVKGLIKECHTKYDAPLRDLKESEAILNDLKLKLNDFINASSRTDMSLDDSGMLSQEHKVDPQVLKDLKATKVPLTNDTFKYEYCEKGVKPISAKVVAVIREGQLVDCVERGLNCQLVLDKTNFYAEGDDQAGDEGTITCDDYVVKINKVYEVSGYIFHDGYVEEGNAVADRMAELAVNEEHRLACSQNHTALHLLSKAMKNILPYFFPLSAHAGPKDLTLNFTSKGSISDDQLRIIERNVQESIQDKLDVAQSQMPIESLKEVPPCKAALIKEFEHHVPVVTIGRSDDSSALKSVEPCCGTHVKSTGDVGSFVIITHKNTKNKERLIRAVTGKQALVVEKDGQIYDKELSELEERVSACLEKPQKDVLELWDCLREVKEAKVYHETELPLLLFREHQAKLTQLTKQLTKATDDFVQSGFREVKSEMEDVLKKFSDEKFIVYHLSSIGDGKKIINYAIEKSTEKPALYFARDGHKSIICSCSVPKSLVSSSFSALLWINPVASVLEGQARTLFKDPELFYSVISKRIDKIDEAAAVAKKFVESYLSN